jgi:hypothetical protein
MPNTRKEENSYACFVVYKVVMSEITASKHKRKPTSRIIPLSIRILAAAAIICVLLSAALMTAPKVRAAVYGTFVNWFDGFTKYGSDRPTTHKLDFEPTLIPEGFVESSRVSYSNHLSLVYTDSNGEHLIFYCSPADNSISINNEGVEYGQVLDETVVYHTFAATSDTYENSVIWERDGYLFYLGAQMPITQLLDIARSVRQ